MPDNATLPQQLQFKHDAVKAHDGTHCTLFCEIYALNKSIKNYDCYFYYFRAEKLYGDWKSADIIFADAKERPNLVGR